MSDLFNSLQNYDNSIEKHKNQYSGLLGLSIDGTRQIKHLSRNGFVYVRLRDNLSEVLQAFNDKVSPVYDLPVLLERRNNIWYVVGRDIDRYQNWGSSAPFLSQHGAQHSFNRDENTGGDVVPIYPDQFMPLLVYPSGTLGSGNLIVAPYLLQRDTDFIYVGNTGTVSVLGYKPTNSQAILGLVYLDTVSGNPGILIGSGTPFSSSITGTSQISPYIPYPTSTDHHPLYAFRLVSGTTSLTWSNLYNIRQFIGGQGGGGLVTGSTVQFFITGSIPFGNPNGNLGEDNAKFRWNSTNRMVEIGQPSSTLRAFATQLGLGLVGDQDITIGQALLAYGTGSLGSPSPTYNGYRSRGTLSNPLPLDYNDALQTWIGAGFDGANWINSTRVRSYANGQWITGTYTPSKMDFEVTPSGSATRRSQFTIYGDSVNIPTGSTYNVGGIPHTHASVSASSDGWTSDTNTWTFKNRTQAFTNDPIAGSDIVLNLANTTDFVVGSDIEVTSSAGTERTHIKSVVANTSITVNQLTLNHTTTSRLITLLDSFTINADVTANIRKGTYLKFTNSTLKYGNVYTSTWDGSNTTIVLITNTDYLLTNNAISGTYYSNTPYPSGFPIFFNYDVEPKGWSTVPTTSVVYKFKTLATIMDIFIQQPGVADSTESNATTLSLSSPCLIINAGGTTNIQTVNNDVLLTVAARTRVGVSGAGNKIIDCFTDMGAGAWTNVNTKKVTCVLTNIDF